MIHQILGCTIDCHADDVSDRHNGTERRFIESMLRQVPVALRQALCDSYSARYSDREGKTHKEKGEIRRECNTRLRNYVSRGKR